MWSVSTAEFVNRLTPTVSARVPQRAWMARPLTSVVHTIVLHAFSKWLPENTSNPAVTTVVSVVLLVATNVVATKMRLLLLPFLLLLLLLLLHKHLFLCVCDLPLLPHLVLIVLCLCMCKGYAPRTDQG